MGMLGYAYAVIGDADAAQTLTLLERAVRAKDPFFSTEPARSPTFATVAGNARYQTLLRSIGL